ncbi:hypothetical protein GDO81_028920 [Engystomops pustulosus]|uniref:Taste receptor type 2 member 40 n=1 Tax=Engystomops pustulosus TaxID=76066 RepID=A0AAV6Z2C8_ENGPU|nr:hypothetical protein GDO81_028920 [Engystomops pustulosus]
MAGSAEGGTNVLYLGLLVPALMALVAGLVIHSFIIGVNVSDWWRGRSVTPVDLIVTLLGILRICAQSAITLDVFLGRFLPLDFLMFTVYLFFTNANVLVTSLLSFIYCLKISNLHTRLFLYLRRMISHRTGRLIVFLLLFSAVNCSMVFVMV